MPELEAPPVAEVRSARAGRAPCGRARRRIDWTRPATRRRRQLLEGADVEDLAHHCRAAEHGALVRAQTLEARCEERVDSGRDVHRLDVANRDPAPVHLLEPPVVDRASRSSARRRAGCLPPSPRRDRGPPGSARTRRAARDQAVAGCIVERLEPHDRARARRSRPSPDARSRRSGRLTQSEQDRDGLRMTRDVLDSARSVASAQ